MGDLERTNRKCLFQSRIINRTISIGLWTSSSMYQIRRAANFTHGYLWYGYTLGIHLSPLVSLPWEEGAMQVGLTRMLNYTCRALGFRRTFRVGGKEGGRQQESVSEWDGVWIRHVFIPKYLLIIYCKGLLSLKRLKASFCRYKIYVKENGECKKSRVQITLRAYKEDNWYEVEVVSECFSGCQFFELL